MKSQKQRRILLQSLTLTLGMTAAGSPAFAGYSSTILASFNGSNGLDPMSGLTVSGTNLYGAAQGLGANYGSIFAVPMAGGTPTVLATFNFSNGSYPRSDLLLSGGNLYGTTSSGGSGYGVVFSVPIAGGTPTVLATFNNSNGAAPVGGLTLSGGTLYGTTSNGGPSGDGVVFSLPITGGTPTVLAAFNKSNGLYPNGDLVLANGTLYGTAQQGGANGYGTLFSVPATGGTPNVMASFSDATGDFPEAGLILSNNVLYGTTFQGGPLGQGSVFSFPVTGGTPTVLGSFNISNGANPSSPLVLSGGLLYGSTPYGGTNGGTEFSVPVTGGLAGGGVTVLASNPDSSRAFGGVALSGTAIYGTTAYGGSASDGSVYALTPNPIVGLSAAVPTSFGSSLGTLTLTSANGSFGGAASTFSGLSTGYFHVVGSIPSTATENFAFDIIDSVPGNLNVDLASLIAQIDSGNYTGYSVDASVNDPTGGYFNRHFPHDGFDFYITITGSTLGTTSPYFGFDLTQINGTADRLTTNAIAVVPEPASLCLLALSALRLPRRRRSF